MAPIRAGPARRRDVRPGELHRTVLAATGRLRLWHGRALPDGGADVSADAARPARWSSWGVVRRFLLYGFAGWILEVLFTGTGAALAGDRSATAKTYLWMHPVYGAGGLVLDRLGRSLARRRFPVGARALAMVPVIYAAEYLAGAALRRTLGACPWDYAQSGGHHFRGLVRWDYAPFWYLAALGFELTRSQTARRPRRTAGPAATAGPTSPGLPTAFAAARPGAPR